MASRDKTAISSSRYSKESERRSNLNKAYTNGSPSRIVKARTSAQPNSNVSNVGQNRELFKSAWNYTSQESAVNGLQRQFSDAPFDELDNIKISVPLKSPELQERQNSFAQQELNRHRYGSVI